MLGSSEMGRAGSVPPWHEWHGRRGKETPGPSQTGRRQPLPVNGREKLVGRCHRQVGRTRGVRCPGRRRDSRWCRASREGRSGGGKRAAASQEGGGGGNGVGGSPAAGACRMDTHGAHARLCPGVRREQGQGPCSPAAPLRLEPSWVIETPTLF